MNMKAAKHRSASGFTLLEVLIALLIFSMGLLGLGGILVLSVQTNYAATQRTQATFLAQSLADRMRVNVIGVWTDKYNVTLTSTPVASCNPVSTGCDPTGVASWDLSSWFDQVRQSLPAPTAVVRCVKTVTVTPPDLRVKPPYQGTCTVELSWSESVKRGTVNSAGTGNSGQQTFAWVFTP
jgi:type IV pilus assembly protein PilV